MKILWIAQPHSWITPLLSALRNSFDGEIALIIPVVTNSKYEEYEKDGIMFFNIPFSDQELKRTMRKETFNKFFHTIQKINPDIIHIHGTERNYSQIQSLIPNIPIVISIQGILNAYKRYNLNFLTKKELIRYNSLKNLLGIGVLVKMEKLFNTSTFELDILKNGKYFIGRTEWDIAHTTLRNRTAKYFTGEELLREAFYKMSQSWQLEKCNEYSIFIPSGISPLKGLHWAIKTVALLKPFYPNIHLYVPGISPVLAKHNKFKKILLGEGYFSYITHQIKTFELTGQITFLPQLNAQEMAKQMQKAHVFLSPSSIDNSPNSIGEAMMIGTPVVTTPVGGITSFLKDNETCLLSPSGDAYLMAFQIKKIFDNKELAQRLSSAAFKVAEKRHHKQNTVNQYISIYKEAINLHNDNTKK